MKNKWRSAANIIVFPLMLYFSTPAVAETREYTETARAFNTRHIEWLAAGDFANLDKSLNGVQKDYESGRFTDLELWDLFNTPFNANDPAFEALYKQWVEAYPRSYAAHQSLEKYYFHRMVPFMGKKEPEAVASLKKYRDLAISEGLTALSLTAKPVMTYCDLIELYGRAGDFAQSRKMLEADNKLAPNNSTGRYWFMNALAEQSFSGVNILDEMRNTVVDVRKTKMTPAEAVTVISQFHGRLLWEERYDELEKEMERVQNDYETGKIDDVVLDRYFPLWNDGDPALEKKYDAWLHAYPNSYAAHVFRAKHFHAAATKARGNRLIKDTSAAEVKGMELYLKKSMDDAVAALPLTPKPLIAYDVMINTAQFSSCDNVCAAMNEAAKKIDPKNSIVRASYMDTLQGRWGGSLEKMQALLDESRKAGVAGDIIINMEDALIGERAWLAYRINQNLEKTGMLVTGY